MNLSFMAPSTRYPSGGVSVVYEFASSMAERGHRVHLCHLDLFNGNVSSLDDIDWFSFSGDVIHHFPPYGPIDVESVEEVDIIFGFSSEAEMPAHAGLPVVLIQGYQMFSSSVERRVFRLPCPKMCVASWLVDIGRHLGVPSRQLVHVPPGLRHEKFHLKQPIPSRGPRVSVCYSAHPSKNVELAFEVLDQVRKLVPELEVTVFGATSPEHELPEGVAYRTNPSQRELVDDIYNSSRVFLCTSNVEGFGLCSIEAMACGAALVTTDNGGSQGFALHGRTALVAAVGDVDALVSHVVSLLHEDDRRVRLAEAGRQYVRRFEWSRSAELLESFLEGYLADPVSYGRPVATAG